MENMLKTMIYIIVFQIKNYIKKNKEIQKIVRKYYVYIITLNKYFIIIL